MKLALLVTFIIAFDVQQTMASRAGKPLSSKSGHEKPVGWSGSRLAKYAGYGMLGALVVGGTIGGVIASNKIKEAQKQAEEEAAKVAAEVKTNQCDTAEYETAQEGLKYIEDCKASTDTEAAQKWIKYHQSKIQKIEAGGSTTTTSGAGTPQANNANSSTPITNPIVANPEVLVTNSSSSDTTQKGVVAPVTTPAASPASIIHISPVSSHLPLDLKISPKPTPSTIVSEPVASPASTVIVPVPSPSPLPGNTISFANIFGP